MPTPGTATPNPASSPEEQRRLPGNRDRAAPAVSSGSENRGTPAAAGAAPTRSPGAGFGEHWPRSAARHALGAGPANAFLNAAADRRTVAPDRVAAPVSPANVLQAGAVISSALITGIDPIYRPDHRAGHRKHLRQPNRPYLACAARHSLMSGNYGNVRSLQSRSCSSGLGRLRTALDRSRAPAWC